MSDQLPERGSVLGVDVGYSPKRRSSAVCRLDWTRDSIFWAIKRFCAVEPERSDTLGRLADRPLLAAAFDGPLRSGFDEIGRYRACERMLTRTLRPSIGKPGQSSTPVGRQLNRAANICAGLVIGSGMLAQAGHAERIDELAVVEAFPSSFLGVLIEQPTLIRARRGDRSDLFFEHLSATGTLDHLVTYLLPDRKLTASFSDVTDHDDRAGLVCALTALGVAACDYVAVGDDDGWIILPPRAFIRNWAWHLLEANAEGSDRLEVSGTRCS